MYRQALCAIVALGLVGIAAPAAADPITGELNIVGGVQVTATDLDFTPPDDLSYGEFDTDTSTGYFAGLSPTVDDEFEGDALDLTFSPAQDPPFTLVTLGATSVTDFLTDFREKDGTPYLDGSLTFDLTEIVDPSLSSLSECTAAGLGAIGTSCYLGPFQLTKTGEATTSIAMVINGIFKATGYDDTLYSGSYTTQLNLTAAQIYNIIVNGVGTAGACPAGTPDGTICTSYSANFVPITAVPEPVTLLTLGAGSLFVAMRRRRSAKSRV